MANLNNSELTTNVLEALFDIILEVLDTVVKGNRWEFRYKRVGEYTTLTREVKCFEIKIYELEALDEKGEFTEPIYEIPLIIWVDINDKENQVMIKFPIGEFDQLPVSPDGWYIPERGFVPKTGCRDEARWYLHELQDYWEFELGGELGK